MGHRDSDSGGALNERTRPHIDGTSGYQIYHQYVRQLAGAVWTCGRAGVEGGHTTMRDV